MKISHSASPRNRSSRNSRSETGGDEIVGAGPIGNGARASSASSARAGPEIRSATEVIGNRLSRGGREKNRERICRPMYRSRHRKPSYGEPGQDLFGRPVLLNHAPRALRGNCGQTTVNRAATPAAGRLVLPDVFGMMTPDGLKTPCSKACPHVPRRDPPDRSDRGAELHAGALLGRPLAIFLV